MTKFNTTSYDVINIKNEFINLKGKNVIVLGGGDTAMENGS